MEPDIDMERQISDAMELMSDMEDLILEYQVSYASALNACAGIHGKIFTSSMVLAYGIEDQYDAVAEIVMSELEELAQRVRDRTVMLVKPVAGEPVN